MKILIIEDEQQLAKDIQQYLEKEQYRCEVACTFVEAEDRIAAYEYDCILLDLMLPGGNGLTLLQKLKNRNQQDGVIIISAKDALDDKIKGLQLGADDYLAKPFHLSELSARIYSVLRRKSFGNSNTIEFSPLKVDLLSKAVTVSGAEVTLTRSEYNLLVFLIANKGRVVAKSAAAEHLSGDMADMMDNHGFVYAHVKNLKKKLTQAGCPGFIKTVYGMGYKWEA